MSEFKRIFGIEKEQVRENCVLCPFLPEAVLKDLAISKLNRGLLFASGSSEQLTVIKTGMGASFVGDSVLYLSDTACKNLILLGTAGLIEPMENLTVGSLITFSSALAMDSFSHCLRGDMNAPQTRSDPLLISKILGASSSPLTQLAGLSFGSLYLEERNLEAFKALKAQAVDMECAALFAAAGQTQKRAASLLVISDILGQKRFHETVSNEDKKNLALSFRQACDIILKVCRA